MAEIHLERDELAQSREKFRMALAIAREIDSINQILQILYGMALLFNKSQPEKQDDILKLVNCVFYHPASSRELRDKVRKFMDELEQEIPEEDTKEIILAGKTADLEDLVKWALAQS